MELTEKETFIAHWTPTYGAEGAEKKWQEKQAWLAERHQAPDLMLDIQPWEAYESPASGKMITSRKERREDMARTNSRPWEGLSVEKQEAQRRKQYEEQRNDARLHEAASRAFYQMDPRKRRELMKG